MSSGKSNATLPALSDKKRTWWTVRSSTIGTGQPDPFSTTVMQHGAGRSAASAIPEFSSAETKSATNASFCLERFDIDAFPVSFRRQRLYLETARTANLTTHPASLRQLAQTAYPVDESISHKIISDRFLLCALLLSPNQR